VIHDPQDALALVADVLAQCEEQIHGQLMSDVKALAEVSQYLVRAGGKRLRPVLSALGAQVLGIRPDPKLMCAGELIHLGSLLHDDVVDLGVTRRGQAVTHSVYGNAAAILGGDYCIARATLLAAEKGNVVLSHRFAQVLTAMAEGEMLQLNRAADLSTTREAYYEVIERKAAVLIAWCTSAHAWVEGREDEARALESYGRSVGMAFQITDDVLDYREDTGKKSGADLRERKVTLPLLHALDRIPSLRERLEDHAPTAKEVGQLQSEIRCSGALSDALEDARGFVTTAMDSLEQLPQGPAKEALGVLGRFVVERVV
jgi:octaprenyl-diphosphate synthase